MIGSISLPLSPDWEEPCTGNGIPVKTKRVGGRFPKRRALRAALPGTRAFQRCAVDAPRLPALIGSPAADKYDALSLTKRFSRSCESASWPSPPGTDTPTSLARRPNTSRMSLATASSSALGERPKQPRSRHAENLVRSCSHREPKACPSETIPTIEHRP